MVKIQRILVPTDGSEGSIKAAETAGELAKALDALQAKVMATNERLIVVKTTRKDYA